MIKPKCAPNQMLKVIKRNSELCADDRRPEHDLVFAVIGCAITDLLDKARHHGAVAFFDHKLFDGYCNFVGLNPDSTRQLLVTGGFLKDAHP